MPTSKIGLHDLDPSLFETLSNISGSNSQTKIFPLQVVASEDNQTVFPIGLDTFDAEKDFAFVQSGVTNLFYGADFTIENKNIILKEGVPAGRTLGIYVLKNVAQIDEEDYVSGANLAPGSVTPDKIGGMLPIEKGGTGATSAEEARTNLETNIKTFTSLEQIGITVGEETIDSIMAALPNNSILMFNVTSSNNINQYPSIGTCIIYKSMSTRTSLTLEGANTGRKWIAEHYNTGTEITWTGWKEIFTTNGGTLNYPLYMSNSKNDYPHIMFGAKTIGEQAHIGYSEEWQNLNLEVQGGGSVVDFNVNAQNPLESKLQLAIDNTTWYNIFGEHNIELLAPHIQNLLQGGNVSMVKSVQRGYTRTVSGTYTQNITIQPVNVNKTFVNVSANMVREFDGLAHNNFACTGRLIDSTTLQINKYDTGSDHNIVWEVIEFY